uniref:Collagen beta(1-O)galactosyltransferase 1 n=1 Tax=Eptatretus burgeri TaxID=7764 RepID=A0A8C4QF98_EPTBU
MAPFRSIVVLFLFLLCRRSSTQAGPEQAFGPEVQQPWFEEVPAVPESPLQLPKVLLVILARNGAASLPYCLGALERQHFPKQRLAVWLATDHNEDDTFAMLTEWVEEVRHMYHHVEIRADHEYMDALGPKDWSNGRYEQVMKLRQEALEFGRSLWADYVLFVDADNILTNPDTLSLLIADNKTIVAPMLDSRVAYSNYWCGMTGEGYYKRTPDYVPIRERKRLGLFSVPMVHSTFLIDLRRAASQKIRFYPTHPDYHWAFDDIIIFAFSCKMTGMPNRSRWNHVDLKLECYLIIVFMINLERRPDRHQLMVSLLDELRIDFKLIKAVDGKSLNNSQIQAMNIDMLPGYEDPYSGRALTKGEIGCFLSHYNIWKKVVRVTGSLQVLVLEDDCRFEPFFNRRLSRIMNDIDIVSLDWDLMFFGCFKGTKVSQATITISKALSHKMYLPPEFGQNPEEYMEKFEERNLRAFSVEPLLIFPTHYTGQQNYISDTETSTIWDDDVRLGDDAVLSQSSWQTPGKASEQGEISSQAQNVATGTTLERMSHNEL